MNDVSLRDFIERIILEHERRFEQRFSDAEKAVKNALAAAEKAVDKSEAAQGVRNALQNEFRASLGDLSKLMWTSKEGTSALDGLRRELESRIKSLEENISGLKTISDNLQGRFAMIAIIWGVIVFAGSVVIKFWH